MGTNRGIKHLLAQVNPVPTIQLSTHFSIVQHCCRFQATASLQILRDVIDTTLDLHRLMYTEAKVDVTQEIEQRAQQAAQAGADHCALCSISCVTSTLASGYSRVWEPELPGQKKLDIHCHTIS